MNLLPDVFLEPHTSSKQGFGLINEVQGLANGKLTVLSGIHPCVAVFVVSLRLVLCKPIQVTAYCSLLNIQLALLLRYVSL